MSSKDLACFHKWVFEYIRCKPIRVHNSIYIKVIDTPQVVFDSELMQMKDDWSFFMGNQPTKKKHSGPEANKVSQRIHTI